MEPLTFRTHALLRRKEFEIEKGHQPSNAFIFVRSGSFFCRFEGETEFTAVEGDIIAFPLTAKFYRKIIDPCQLYLAYFTINEEHPLAKYFPKGKLVFSDTDKIKKDCQNIFSYMNIGDSISKEIIGHLINDIYITYLIDSGIRGEDSNNISHTVQMVIAYFFENLSEKISLKDVARISGMSPNGITQKFKREIGYSPMDYLIHLRLQKAADLLRHTTETVNEISSDVGYDNIFYFSNSYKKAYGISPSQERKLHSTE